MSDVKDLEEQLANAKLLSSKRQKLLKLLDNPEFKELIIKDFSTEECARYAQVSGDTLTQTPEEIAHAIGMAQSAGYLKRWIAVILQQGYVAERDMEEVENELIAARAEEAGE